MYAPIFGKSIHSHRLSMQRIAFTAEDPKRALVHALQNDLSRMSVLLERLDELLSA